jgi:SAM-dependent methyltransferase
LGGDLFFWTNGTNLSFGARYASVYDALYQDKNYAAEVRFVLDQIRSFVPQSPLQILDLGCGTGLHAVQLAQAGISVMGIDRSTDMIAAAEKRKELLSENLRNLIHFKVGDIRAIDLNHQYDAVISLFHVISYAVQNSDLEATFLTARRHLNVGGVFIFDFWYGPAVLREPPQPRVRTIQIGENDVRRVSIPEWDRERSVVCVNYDIEIRNIASGRTTREREEHFVRYFFLNELESRLAAFDFEVERFGEWLTGDPPSDSTFGVYALAKAK